MLRAPTPPDQLVDARGRPYFLWDTELTLEDWLALVRGPDPDDAAYWLARALRDAKPDDVLELVDWDWIERDFTRMAPFLGRRRAFWAWWLTRLGRAVDASSRRVFAGEHGLDDDAPEASLVGPASGATHEAEVTFVDALAVLVPRSEPAREVGVVEHERPTVWRRRLGAALPA
ncbi:MAG: hypothetical protein AB1Z98_07740 [Nannocystaceae bacterium]